MKIEVLIGWTILTGKLIGHGMSENWGDNSEDGTEFHDKIDDSCCSRDKPRKDYTFHGNSSHSYIQTYHQRSPFDDAMR